MNLSSEVELKSQVFGASNRCLTILINDKYKYSEFKYNLVNLNFKNLVEQSIQRLFHSEMKNKRRKLRKIFQ